jgi:DinB family protein
MPEPQFQYPETIQDYIAQLTSGRDYVNKTADSISWPVDARPVPERWSAAEILYHLYLSEKRILGNLRKTLQSGERHERKHDKYLLSEWEAINKVTTDPEVKFTAPAALAPSDTPPLDEIRRLLDENRKELVQFVKGSSIDDLASYSMLHPAPNVGNLTGVGWLSILVMHDIRHGNQIERIGASLNEQSQ